MTTLMRWGIGGVIVGWIAVMATGQPSQPTTEPTTTATTMASTEPATEPTTESTTEPATMPTNEPTTLPATEPTTMAVITKPEPGIAPTTMPALAGIPEGSIFPERVGRLARSEAGRDMDFVFEKDGKQTKVPILPNLELMQMENAVEEGGWELKFQVSGRITEYQGRNFILLDHAVQVQEKEAGKSRENDRTAGQPTVR